MNKTFTLNGTLARVQIANPSKNFGKFGFNLLLDKKYMKAIEQKITAICEHQKSDKNWFKLCKHQPLQDGDEISAQLQAKVESKEIEKSDSIETYKGKCALNVGLYDWTKNEKKKMEAEQNQGMVKVISRGGLTKLVPLIPSLNWRLSKLAEGVRVEASPEDFGFDDIVKVKVEVNAFASKIHGKLIYVNMKEIVLLKSAGNASGQEEMDLNEEAIGEAFEINSEVTDDAIGDTSVDAGIQGNTGVDIFNK